MFDLYSSSLNIIEGKEQGNVPGFLVFSPPRRTVRGRDQDRLMIYVTSSGGDRAQQSDFGRVLNDLARIYYETSGSVTSGLRAVAERFNSYLLHLNRGREPVLVTMNLAVLRKDVLYLAHGGETHTFLARQDGQLEHYFDPQPVPRYMGLEKSIGLRFFQFRIQAEDFLIFCAEPPETWTPTLLASGSQMTIHDMRRRLLHVADNILQAAVIHFLPGKGENHQIASGQPAPARTETPPRENQVEKPAHTATSERKKRPSSAPVSAAVKSKTQGTTPDKKAEISPTPKKKADNPLAGFWLNVRIETIKARKKMASRLRAYQAFRERHFGGLKQFWEQMLPGEDGQPNSLSSSLMLFIAVAVPLVVVAISVTVYINRGRGEAHLKYLQEAQVLALDAQDQTDKILAYQDWQIILDWLDEAEKYGSTEESSALRELANQEIDMLEGITRLDMRPALTNALPNTIKISKMDANETEVYALDANSGSVLRFFLTGEGYTIDENFKCGPGPSGSLMVGPLVDLTVLPPNNIHRASIMAIDNNGVLLYCSVGEDEIPVTRVLPPPELGWGEVTAMTLQYETLYVMDVLSTAVWVYTGDNLDFTKTPEVYFDSEIPDLMGMIDMAASGETLYYLRKSGTMVTCVSSNYSFQPTECEDPTPFRDMRPGYENQPVIFNDAIFTHMMATRPPDPSIFLLDTNSGSVFHFSLRLNMQRQYQPRFSQDYVEPAHEVSAFIITPNRLLLLAYNNQIYYTQMP